MIDLTATDLTTKTAVELRSIGSQAGVKGAAKARKSDLLAALLPIQDEQRAAKQPKIEVAKRSNLCGVCGKRRIGTTGQDPKSAKLADLCGLCFDEGGWENSHSDSNHDGILSTPEADRTPEQLAEIDGCWICFPQLNLAQAEPTGRSRAGMVILAKGDETHKSQTFKAHAEAAGWKVSILGSVVSDEDGEEIERYVATAKRGKDRMTMAWDGRAYDYAGSSAFLNGKSRKVRNLKEATRLLVA
jgi:hypothetical protein